MKKMSNTLTVKSMAEALTEDKVKNGSKSKVYKELSDEHKGEQIAQSVSSKALSLKQAINAPKVDLSNTEEVQERCFMYLEACSLSSCFPSVMGLSGALGCSRQNLNRWLLSHPGHSTTDFVNMAKDVMADILTNASLYNNANAVAVIFQLKNHFEHADRVEIAPVVQNQLDTDDYNAEDIRRRYLIDTDDTQEE
ncbi:terminase small subunit [Peptoniphilus mikwangii]|uniref:terminase small subunit n=1 Tax=Peptoniphilus mikwangii TaxID=1354300 RepID=UPI00056B502A|nr:terminase small subunit [Peptoniphilus mikwangii]